MKFLYPPRFESPAEAEIFPLFNSYAIKNHLTMEYQKKLGISDFSEDWMDYRIERYRVDYTFEGYNEKYNKIKLAVEIDGKEYHQNIFREDRRDRWLIYYDYKVLHIPAKDVFTNKLKIIELLNLNTGCEYFY